MKNFSNKTKAYILGTIVTGGLLAIWEFSHFDPINWWLVLIVSILASLSLILKVLGATERSHYNISFVLYSFVFVIGGVQAAFIVIIISNIVEWVYHKYPWYIQSFNITSYLITVHVCGLIYGWINPGGDLLSLMSLLGVLASMAVFAFLNHLMVGMVVWLARGENFAQSGVFGWFSLMLDYSLLSIGIATAYLYTINVYATVLSTIPIYLIYSTLKVPALERKSNTDAKTGLYNSEYFSTALQNELSRMERFDHPLTVVMGDLDLLRNINNTYGHLAGDMALVGIASILKKSSKEFDVVSRFGGEEYAILMPETTVEQAYERVEQMRAEIASAQFNVPTSVTPIQVTMSFGIAGRIAKSTMSANELVHNADVALYHAKLTGRNKAVIYTEEGKNPFEIAQQRQQPAQNAPVEAREAPVEAAAPPEPAREEPVVPPGRVSAGANIPSQPINAEVRPRKRGSIPLLIGSMCFAALLLLWLTYRPGKVDWIGLAWFAGMVIITEWLSLDIYVRDTSVSTSAAPMVAGFLMFGPVGVAVLSIVFATVTLIKHHSHYSRHLFNSSNQIIAGSICTGLILIFGRPFGGYSPLIQFFISLGAALLVFASTSMLLSAIIELNVGIRFSKIWREKFAWLLPYYLAIGLMAYTMIYSYTMIGMVGILVVLVPLFMLRFSQHQYLTRTKSMVDELTEKNNRLEISTLEINKLNEDLLNVLAEAHELRDVYAQRHSKHVANYAALIAQQMGLPTIENEIIRKAGLLHDVGKLGIPEAILHKPSRLTHEEYEIVKQHASLGAEIVGRCASLQDLVPVILHHHEHFDGTGYPNHLKGDQIPLASRIIAVADAVEAMASDRPYRNAMPVQVIVAELQKYRGTQFDPSVVAAFLEITAKQGASIIVNSARAQTDAIEAR